MASSLAGWASSHACDPRTQEVEAGTTGVHEASQKERREGKERGRGKESGRKEGERGRGEMYQEGEIKRDKRGGKEKRKDV